MQDNKNEILTIDLRKKSKGELVDFLNALIAAKQIVRQKGLKTYAKKVIVLSHPKPTSCSL
jgi:hypothetical protein